MTDAADFDPAWYEGLPTSPVAGIAGHASSHVIVLLNGRRFKARTGEALQEVLPIPGTVAGSIVERNRRDPHGVEMDRDHREAVAELHVAALDLAEAKAHGAPTAAAAVRLEESADRLYAARIAVVRDSLARVIPPSEVID